MKHSGIFHVEWGLFIPVVVLVIFGLTTLFSINPIFFRTQLLYVVISIFAFFFFSHVNYKSLQLYAMPIYIASLVVLAFVLLMGFESRGAVRWIDIFGFRIQFSEIFKPFLMISLATYLARSKNTSLYTFFSTFLFLFPVAFLIFLQPDLGTALVYVGVCVLTLIVFGFPLLWFMGGLAVFLGSLPLLWPFLHDYQKQRLLTFLHPGNDPLGTSYNSIQAVIAVGSGSLFGKGLGQGTQSGLLFLPERQTDFIFATLSEEFGFIGGMLVIFAFAFLLYKLYRLFLDVDDPFRKIFTACAFSLFLLQFFVNVGMNIGIIPIVGVTLPFVSYGGSSLLSNFILLGFLSSFRIHSRNKDILEIR